MQITNTVFLFTDHNNVQQCVESSASFTEDHNNYKTARKKERKKERKDHESSSYKLE
jgi:hypothetical protein